jgi:hypothetical protein
MLMSKLSTDERNLLRYYAETARILHGSGRGVVHQHLLSMGYIEERTVNMQDSVIVVTQAGRRALGFRSYAALVFAPMTSIEPRLARKMRLFR